MGSPSAETSPALAMIAVGLCACAYQPGSFRTGRPAREFAVQRATVGCLDVAVAGRWDPAHAGGQVVEIDFGNRCDRAVVVDFTALRAKGRDDEGGEGPLALFDPRKEIRPLSLEARTAGREVLEWRPANARRLRAACLDVSGLAGRPSTPRWLCVARPERPSPLAGKGGPS
ncbi:MAG TPA: hypothetical protein VEL05_12280 [Candidatus Acidoferrum sp.]|nr:hypothetical protein [Candidatus Acidoferrum sp.]